MRPQELGAGPTEAIADATQLINQAKLLVLLLGMQASEPANATALSALLEKIAVRVHLPGRRYCRSSIHYLVVELVCFTTNRQTNYSIKRTW